MEIPIEIKETQQRMSELNGRFMEFVSRHPETMKRSSFKRMDLKDDLFTLQPWPTFIKPSMVEDFKEASEVLYHLIRDIPRRIFNNDPARMADYYKTTEESIRFQMGNVTPDHLQDILARVDYILSPDGLKCMEYNVSVNLGGWYIPVWETLCLSTPIISKFIHEYRIKVKNRNLFSLFLEHAVNSYLKKHSTGELNITLIKDKFVADGRSTIVTYLNQLYRQVLKKKFSGLKGMITLCGYPALKLENDCIYYRGKQVHVVAEMDQGQIPEEVIHAFKAGTIRLFNGPVGQLLSEKLNLALLSDDQYAHLYTPEELAAIERFVPWSRKVEPSRAHFRGDTVEMEPFLFQNRERMVLKPSVGLGGKGVMVGKYTPHPQWEEAIRNAMAEGNWLVQEFVETSPGLYQDGDEGYTICDIVWGFFLFGDNYTGAWSRVMPGEKNKGAVNCHQGATVSLVFEVDT